MLFRGEWTDKSVLLPIDGACVSRGVIPADRSGSPAKLFVLPRLTHNSGVLSLYSCNLVENCALIDAHRGVCGCRSRRGLPSRLRREAPRGP